LTATIKFYQNSPSRLVFQTSPHFHRRSFGCCHWWWLLCIFLTNFLRAQKRTWILDI